ncbi:Dynein heavy chain C-terminal domain [Phytophthora infestans]|uniref:Dynein heavy chain C-terminal domain n=1 Tax=Phytophthora infestans TaxID=4787 RepID=A0A833W3C2_PHYIN|nr:Dynein heavy chain C-terminal domain [Phytophthora infestans]
MPRLGTTPTCQKLAAASVGSIRVSREDPIGNVASDIHSKVPEPIDVDHVRKKMGSTPTPTQVVLLRELDRWNLLAYRMGVSLGDLQKAVVGEIGMSDDLDAVDTTASAGRRERRRRVLRQGTFPRRRILGSRAWCLAPQKPKQLVEELLSHSH